MYDTNNNNVQQKYYIDDTRDQKYVNNNTVSYKNFWKLKSLICYESEILSFEIPEEKGFGIRET